MEDYSKKEKKKKILVISSIVAILIIAIGATYAFYTYSNTGLESKLIAGDIYMKYKETSNINLSGAMPSATYPATATGNYFEFQITGKNTSSRDITYNVKLAYGDEETGKDRLHDNHLLFKLVEVVNNEEVSVTPEVNDKRYTTIPEATLYTATIPGGGASATESTRTFRVYARIDENVVIGNTNQDYTIAEWNNSYASVKINVDGGFVGESEPTEQETLIPNATPASCFTTSENQDETLTITGYDADTCGTDVVIPNIIDVNENPPTGVSNNNKQNNLSFMPNKIETNNYNELVKKTTNENWKRVTIIGEESFYCYTQGWNQEEGNETYITSVIIPDTVTTIGDSAFSDNSISSLTIPNSVTTIGDSAFSDNSISSLTLNMNDLTGIGSDVFRFDSNGVSLTINNAQVIPDNFESNLGTESITSLTLGNSVTTIGYYAFNPGGDYNVNSFDTLVIPNSVTTIGECAFFQNNITNLTLGNSVTTIGDSAFSENYGLSSVVIPNSVTTIGSYAFAENQLTSLIIPNSVTTIGDSAFYNNQLTSVTIPNSVTTIGSGAFSGNQLTSVTIPNSVTTIGSDAFAFDSNSNNNTLTIDMENISSTFSQLSISSLTLGEHVQNIGDNAFNGNQLTSLTLGNNVTTIGDYAFSGNQLTSVTIPDSVTSIGDYAFSGNQLTSLTLGNNVTTIGESAFNGNQLTSLTLGNNVTTIGDSAFYGNQLTSLTIPNSVTTIGSDAFEFDSSSNNTLSIDMTNIPSYIFESSSISTLTLGEHVQNIGDSAFSYNQLTSLTIPNNVTSIGNSAFDSNYNLSSVTLNMNNLSNFNFYNSFGSNNTISTVIVNNATSIPDYTFDNANIENLIIGNSVTTIGSYSLSLGQSGANIPLPSSVVSIASDAFGSENYYYVVTFSKSCTDIKNMSGYPFGADISSFRNSNSEQCETSDETGNE